MARADRRLVADAQGFARSLTGPQGAATGLAMRMARQTVNAAVMKAPVDSGILRNSISADPAPRVDGMRVTTRVEASANYAVFVHEGVKGGKIIRPVNASVLRFPIGGRFVFAKEVRQGAQKARPFLLNGAKEAGARLGFDVSGVP